MTLPAHQIDVWKPASQEDQIKALILLGALLARPADDVTVDKAAYYIALDGVTRHGLSEAVKAILQGKLGHTFFPSPPELRQQCDAAMEWHEREADRIRRREQMARERSPERSPLTEDEKQRQEERMARFHAGINDQKAAEAEALMASERAEIRAKYGMTDEVLASMRDAPEAVPQIKAPTFKRSAA